MAALPKGGASRAVLAVLALLSGFLLLQAFGSLPFDVSEVNTRWVSMVGLGVAALGFGVGGSVLWCVLFAVGAVILNPLYPLPLGDMLHSTKITAGVVAAAAVVRNW
ncbi:MAG: hypothetical protein RL136_2612 [Planctomycetota bacterium]|jgi:hypothetical protein